MPGSPKRVGVLALQGAFAAHQAALERLGADTVAVRQPKHLVGIDALVLPGGESTTMSKLLVSTELFDPLQSLLADGLPALGTCAGAILLSNHIDAGRSDQRCFGVIDMAVLRNGYGRQVDSFETDLDVDGLSEPFHATFIRAPIVESTGSGVRTLAHVGENAVFVRSGPHLATTFHPELGSDDRLHQLFLDSF